MRVNEPTRIFIQNSTTLGNMNEEKFSGKSEIYDKYRPSYPSGLFDLLYSKYVTPQSVIADVGSGTGKFAKLLLERGNTVYCVEPNADMMHKAEQLLCGYDGFLPVCANAENTTLPDASVDFITAAQAFHWFDKRRFADECKRISKDKAVCALVWNAYDAKCAAVKELEALNFSCLPKFKGFAGGASPESGVLDFFRQYETFTFVQDSIFDFDAFAGRCFSSSYSPSKQSEEGKRYLALVSDFFKKHADGDIISLPVLTVCHVGSVL